MTQEQLDQLRHSSAHLLAAAVLELWPSAKRTIGPPIENGFYYDFDFGETKIVEDDLKKIEEKMQEILPKWEKFSHEEVSKAEALKMFEGNEYKQELIEEFSGEGAKGGQKLTVYTCGGFSDLCRGGHSENPSRELRHFKLLSLAGAYWRGSEKNKMLTRIYGTAWPTKDELMKYLKMLEEAKKRDHKKLGPELELFMFHETSPGMPYWLPNGVIMYNQLVNFWRTEHRASGYQEIVSPLLNKKELYITSGHYEHYWPDMFVANMGEGEEYGIKAMNCPNAMIVFGSKSRSYRDLPLRFSDTDTLHRYERSGTLNGLLRVREFRQDDAHCFVTEEQIGAEYERILEIVKKFYSIFGMEYSFRLGTRPESFMGDVETWNNAEAHLKKILENAGKPFTVAEGDGAFYGSKVDILMRDCLGREWQMGTIQLDFQQPRRFNLEYAAMDGSKKTPVAIHRVIYGSLERFMGVLIEHYAGAFPLWLSPVQAALLPVSEKHVAAAKQTASELELLGIRVTVDEADETIGKKVRNAAKQKVPYIIVLGDRELEGGEWTVRVRGVEEQLKITKQEFVAKLQKEIAERA